MADEYRDNDKKLDNDDEDDDVDDDVMCHLDEAGILVHFVQLQN